MRIMIHKAQASPRRVVFPEGDHEKILRAAHILVDEKIANPILLGNAATISAKAAELGLVLDGIQVVDPANWPSRELYAETLYSLRQRRGLTHSEANEMLSNRNVFGSIMVHLVTRTHWSAA